MVTSKAKRRVYVQYKISKPHHKHPGHIRVPVYCIVALHLSTNCKLLSLPADIIDVVYPSLVTQQLIHKH